MLREVGFNQQSRRPTESFKASETCRDGGGRGGGRLQRGAGALNFRKI